MELRYVSETSIAAVVLEGESLHGTAGPCEVAFPAEPGNAYFENALATGLPIEPYAAPPLTIDDYRVAIQAKVDATARSRSYDSGITCASYVGSTNADWAAEASAFVTWRDAVWTHAYIELAKVEAGQRPQPTIPQIIAELPAIDWPV